MMQRPEIQSRTLELLDRLGRFWSFPRKKLALEVRSDLQTLQEQAGVQHARLLSVQALASKQEQDLSAALAQGTVAVAERDKARQLCALLQTRQNEAAQRIGKLETLLSQQGRDLESSRQSIAMLHEANEQWEAAQASLQDDLQQITSQHLTLREKFELVQNVLSQPAPTNNDLEAFARLIREDYLRFAAEESSLADEAGAFLELQAIHQELELIVDFPSARSKSLLAVAGGFSSGKSRFINSFITGGEISLAVGINPVTVVPSYVVCDECPQVRGYATNGGSFELKPELYASLSHEYLESFGFDLRGIMPFISVRVPMEQELFENLCVIDTPGYNPGQGKATSVDNQVAQTFVGQAKAMIWVIGLGTDGTISASDLEFIERAGLSGESLYILLNKADLKAASAIEDIMDQVELGLESYGVEFAGITAYSSPKRKVYASRGQSLEDFLRHHNHKHDVTRELEAKIDGVFDRYKRAMATELARQADLRKQLEEYKLTTLQVGGSQLYQQMSDLCTAIESGLDTSVLKTQASECEALRKRFKEAARATLDETLAANPARAAAFT